MKKIFSFVFAAAALFAAVSCQKEVANDDPASKTEGFTVTVSHGTDTKTTLVNGVKTYWTSTDKLTVFDAQLNNRCFEYVSSADEGETATFETPEFIMPADEDLATSPLVAVYPYNENLSLAYPAMTLTGVNIPAAQTAEADDFDPEATIALAFSNAAGKDNLTFNNLYSLLKLVIKKDDVKKVTVKANGDDDKLAGTGSVQFNQQGGYEFTMTEGTNEVVLNGEFVNGSTYYIAVAPGTYANGFSVYLDDTQVKTTTDSRTLQANYVYNLGNLAIPYYFYPNAWNTGGAWYAAYFFGENDINTWVKLADADSDGNYEFVVPEGGYTHVIFCRMNPAYNELAWDSNNIDRVWDQTVDIELSGASKDNNCFKMYNGSWNNGLWLPLNAEPQDQPKTTRYIYLVAGVWDDDPNAYFEAWCWGTGIDSSWTIFESTQETGVYKCTVDEKITGMKILRKGKGTHQSMAWESWNDTGDLTVPNDKNCFSIEGWSYGSWSNK